MLKIRRSDGTEVQYDSKVFSFRVMQSDLQIIYRNTARVFYTFPNGVWASALETSNVETSKTN